MQAGTGPPETPRPNPQSLSAPPSMKGHFVNVVTLRSLKWGSYPTLFEWAPNVIT